MRRDGLREVKIFRKGVGIGGSMYGADGFVFTLENMVVLIRGVLFWGFDG